MATFWTRKGDQEDDDEKTAKPFAEFVSHGNINFPLSGDNKPQSQKAKGKNRNIIKYLAEKTEISNFACKMPQNIPAELKSQK